MFVKNFLVSFFRVWVIIAVLFALAEVPYVGEYTAYYFYGSLVPLMIWCGLAGDTRFSVVRAGWRPTICFITTCWIALSLLLLFDEFRKDVDGILGVLGAMRHGWYAGFVDYSFPERSAFSWVGFTFVTAVITVVAFFRHDTQLMDQEAREAAKTVRIS